MSVPVPALPPTDLRIKELFHKKRIAGVTSFQNKTGINRCHRQLPVKRKSNSCGTRLYNDWRKTQPWSCGWLQSLRSPIIQMSFWIVPVQSVRACYYPHDCNQEESLQITITPTTSRGSFNNFEDGLSHWPNFTRANTLLDTFSTV